MKSMDSTSWLDTLESELKTIPKLNVMQSKSNIYMFEMTDTGREKIKDKLNHNLSFLWKVCHYSVEQKKAFEYLCNNLYKDNSGKTCLAFCDIEVAFLKQYYSKNKQIFESLEVYKEQINKLRSTGSVAEKSLITKNLLETEKTLKNLEEQYRLENGRNFYTWGKTITETIEEFSSNNYKNSREITSDKDAYLEAGCSSPFKHK